MQSTLEYRKIGACRYLYDIQTRRPHQSPPQADDPSRVSVLAVIQMLELDVGNSILFPSTSPDSSLLAHGKHFHIAYPTSNASLIPLASVTHTTLRPRLPKTAIPDPPEPNSGLAWCLELAVLQRQNGCPEAEIRTFSLDRAYEVASLLHDCNPGGLLDDQFQQRYITATGDTSEYLDPGIIPHQLSHDGNPLTWAIRNRGPWHPACLPRPYFTNYSNRQHQEERRRDLTSIPTTV